MATGGREAPALSIRRVWKTEKDCLRAPLKVIIYSASRSAATSFIIFFLGSSRIYCSNFSTSGGCSTKAFGFFCLATYAQSSSSKDRYFVISLKMILNWLSVTFSSFHECQSREQVAVKLLCFCLDVRLCAEIAPVTQTVEMIFYLWGRLDDLFFGGTDFQNLAQYQFVVSRFIFENSFNHSKIYTVLSMTSCGKFDQALF